MKTTRGLFVFSLLAALIGCETVENARNVQEAVAPRAKGEARLAPELPAFDGSLEQYVNFALDNRPSMRQARLEVEDARLALKEIAANAPLASSTPWTAFGADASLGHSESSTPAHFDKLKSNTDGNGSASLSLDILIWDFGRNKANASAQAERVIAAELSLVQEGYTVFEEVASTYFERLEGAALLEVAITNERMRSEHFRLAEQRLEAGEAQKLDVLRAKLDLAESREKVVAASNNFMNCSSRFASKLGLEASNGKILPLGVEGSALEGMSHAFEETGFKSAELYSFARTNSPSIQVSRARLKAASYNVDYAINDLLPNLSASVSLNWSDPLWTWRWGVNAAQSLFTGFKRTTAIDRAAVALESALADLDDAELGLSVEIEVAVANRDNSKEAIATAKASVASAKENLDTVREQLFVGDVSRVEYTEAVADYASSLASLVEAFYAHQISEAKLFALTGQKPLYRKRN